MNFYSLRFYRRSFKKYLFVSFVVLPFMLNGCMVGPKYKRPAAIISPRFKELRPAHGWQYATPQMAGLPKGPWWHIYHDPFLNKLEGQVQINNQNLVQYAARYRNARATINAIRAQLYPTLSADFSFNRQSSGNRSRSSGTMIDYNALSNNKTTRTYNTYGTGLVASWDLDVWGRIRRQIQAQIDETQASAADLANARLSYQAQLATAYFNLRYEDSLYQLLTHNIAFYERAYQITKNQYAAGTITRIPLLQAQTQLEQTRAQAIATNAARAQYEHAIATLIGKPPADVSIPRESLPNEIPSIPVSIPATLLQRRPDIAAAERRMAEYNAQIGTAIAAFYPDIRITARYTYGGDPLATLIQLANRIWALGASASEVLFEGGARLAAVREAKATYNAYVAAYRQTVLNALQSVEDQLANLRIMAQQAQEQAIAVKSSKQAAVVAFNQYMAGTSIYTTVISAEVTALSNTETALEIQKNRLIASVNLIIALGGGWDASSLPKMHILQMPKKEIFFPFFAKK